MMTSTGDSGSSSSGAGGSGTLPAPRGFYSPWFHSYRSLAFYSHLLSAVRQYARMVDSAGKHFRQLVWRELYQFAGCAPSTDSAFEISTADAHGMLEPFVVSLLRLPTVNLVALELVYQSFHQAQQRYPDVFANMFVPIADGGAMEDTPADPDDIDLNNSDGIEGDDVDRDGSNDDEGNEWISGAKSLERVRKRGASEHEQLLGTSVQSHDTIWGHTIASALLQLNMLKAWIPTLERLSPFHKKALWDVCCLVPMFASAYPSAPSKSDASTTAVVSSPSEAVDSGNGKRIDDTVPSFRSLITSWVHNPLQNTPYITVLFAAVAYLSYHKVIKHEFYYPGSRVPVFARRIDDAIVSDGASADALGEPPKKRRQQMDHKDDKEPEQSVSDDGKELEGLTVEGYRRMLNKMGLRIPHLPPTSHASNTMATSSLKLSQVQLLNRIASMTMEQSEQPSKKGQITPERALAIMDLCHSISDHEEGHASAPKSLNAEDTERSLLQQTQQEDTISADEPTEQFIGLAQELNAFEHDQQGSNSLAVDRSILELPDPTQSGPTVVQNSMDVVHSHISHL